MPLHFIKTQKAKYIVSTISEVIDATIAGKRWSVGAYPAICSRTGRTLYLYSYQFRLWNPRPLGEVNAWLVFDKQGRQVGRGDFQHEALASVP
jgi:hypothetical protein